MNSKQFGKLIVLFLVICAIGLFFVNRGNKSWIQGGSEIGGKVIPDFPMNDISALTVKGQDGEVSLGKVDESWRVKDRDDYPADFSKIRELLLNINDLSALSNIKAGPSRFKKLELSDPNEDGGLGTLLTFNDKDGKALHQLMLGKQHMRESAPDPRFPGGGGGEWPDGRIVMPNGDAERIALVSEPFSGIDVEPKQWLSKDFFKVEKLQSAEVTHTNELDSWSVSRESDSDDMSLAGISPDQEVDSSRSYGLKNILSSASFNDVGSKGASIEDVGMDNPIVAKLKTFEDFSYTVKVGSENDAGDYPVQVTVEAEIPTEREAAEDEADEDKARLDQEFADNVKKLNEKLELERRFEGWTYFVSKYTVDTLLKKRSELIKEKEEGEDSTAASEAQIPAIPLDGLNAIGDPLGTSGNLLSLPPAQAAEPTEGHEHGHDHAHGEGEESETEHDEAEHAHGEGEETEVEHDEEHGEAGSTVAESDEDPADDDGEEN